MTYQDNTPRVGSGAELLLLHAHDACTATGYAEGAVAVRPQREMVIELAHPPREAGVMPCPHSTMAWTLGGQPWGGVLCTPGQGDGQFASATGLQQGQQLTGHLGMASRPPAGSGGHIMRPCWMKSLHSCRGCVWGQPLSSKAESLVLQAVPEGCRVCELQACMSG